MEDINKENNFSSMNDDLLLITDILEKYALDKEDKDGIEEVRKIIDRFNNLSKESKIDLMSNLIWRVSCFAQDVKETSCEENGHTFTKWRRVSYNNLGMSRKHFVEDYGSEYIWFHNCKVCCKTEFITEEEYKTMTKKKQLKRGE